jgi:hypothetical protein
MILTDAASASSIQGEQENGALSSAESQMPTAVVKLIGSNDRGTLKQRIERIAPRRISAELEASF